MRGLFCYDVVKSSHRESFISAGLSFIAESSILLISTLLRSLISLPSVPMMDGVNLIRVMQMTGQTRYQSLYLRLGCLARADMPRISADPLSARV